MTDRIPAGIVLRATGALLLGGVLVTHVAGQTVKYDLVIEDGRVMDPETGLDAVRNVGIRGDTVVRITADPLEGAKTIDARGLVVAPGFIELFQHAHDPESYRLNALDGVTSSLDLEVVNGGVLDTDAFTGHALLHYGTNAGHGAARQTVFDTSVPAAVPPVTRPSRLEPGTPEQLTRVTDLVRKELERGGLGVSVVTWPGITRFEVIEMFRLAAERQSIAVVRPRSRGRIEPGSSVEAIEEIIGAAAITGASTHIIHLHMFGLGNTREVLAMIDGALARGLDITADARPYRCYSALISTNNELFNPGWRERLGLDYADLTVGGQPLTKERFDRLRDMTAPQDAWACWMPQEMVDAAILHPRVMISGHAVKSGPHSAGTFAHVIAEYVRSAHRLSLMEALRKMSLMPAQLLERTTPVGRKKGRVQEGKDADLVVFDPQTIADRATDQSPYEPSVGVQYLVVAGTVVVADGEIVPDVFPGRALVGPSVPGR
jgi:N-acyl-D-aspartate/D-glutamate deacylase